VLALAEQTGDYLRRVFEPLRSRNFYANLCRSEVGTLALVAFLAAARCSMTTR
jgi:hypothetical protein